MSSTAAHGLRVETADLEKSRPPRWAWQDRFLLGYFNLIVGEEGIGKGTLAAWMLARLTRGELRGDLYETPCNVAVIADEDSFQDVWTPRLHAASADLNRVRRISKPDGEYLELAADQAHLKAAVEEHDFSALYLDAVVDNVGAGTDDRRGKQVRDALAPVRHLAVEQDIAVIGSLHPNKAGETFRQLVPGAGWNAVTRSGLLLTRHPDNDDRRVLTRGKGNLSKDPGSFEFEIEEHAFEAHNYVHKVPRVTGETLGELTTSQVLAKPSLASTDRLGARALIASRLEDGQFHPASEIIGEAEATGAEKRTVQRAADDLGVEKSSIKGVWHWRL
jgi:hypothetical protein